MEKENPGGHYNSECVDASLGILSVPPGTPDKKAGETKLSYLFMLLIAVLFCEVAFLFFLVHYLIIFR